MRMARVGAPGSMTNPDGLFSALGEEVARQVDELTDKLAGDDRPGEGYLVPPRRSDGR